jgi:hypothetical protein
MTITDIKNKYLRRTVLVIVYPFIVIGSAILALVENAPSIVRSIKECFLYAWKGR